jgi:HD superfamily phosphodiesterase
MTCDDAMWASARERLVIAHDHADEELLVWEHTVRVTRSTQRIAQAADVPKTELDATALTAAAIYHDVGWVEQLRAGAISCSELLAKPISDGQRDLAIDALKADLKGVLSPGSLARAAEAVGNFNRRETELAEAMILGDAHNLDEVGAISLWHTVRRHALDGKGVQAALEMWQRRQEYGFYKARIDEFRFESVRELARHRLKRLESVMANLAVEHSGQDLPVADSPDRTKVTSAQPSSR